MAANKINGLTAMEAVYMTQLFHLQQGQPNGVSVDMLPYTAQITWLVCEMGVMFPGRKWTEKLVYRTLLRMRKASLLDRSELINNRLQTPCFGVDDDVETCKPKTL